MLTGLFLITPGITYRMQVISAVVDKRTIAGHVAALGAGPVDMLRRHFDGDRFSPMFTQHLTALTPEVVRLGERHLAFPVLHYFHAETRAKSVPVALTMLDTAVPMLTSGVDPRHRADIGAVRPLARAVRELVETLDGSFLPRTPEPAPVPGIEELARAGLPTADAGAYADAVARCGDHRRRLHGWCISDGWMDAVPGSPPNER